MTSFFRTTLRAVLGAVAVPLLAAPAAAHVQVLAPNGGESLQGQQIYQIDWIDTINHGSSVTYEIEFSDDGGATWESVASGLPYTGGSSSYAWIVPDVDTTQGLIRVTMHVSTTTSYDDVSDAPFTVDASYVDYGSGTPVNGVTPTLEMHEVPYAGNQVMAHAAQAQPAAPAYVTVGSRPVQSVIAGVTVLNPADHAILPAQVDANGEVILPLALPASAAGRTAYVQVLVRSAPSWSATAGVEFDILP